MINEWTTLTQKKKTVKVPVPPVGQWVPVVSPSLRKSLQRERNICRSPVTEAIQDPEEKVVEEEGFS